MNPQNRQNEQNFDRKYQFRGHLSTFRPLNKTKSGPLKSINNTQTLFKQDQNSFEKFQKTTFRDTQTDQKNPSKSQKIAFF